MAVGEAKKMWSRQSSAIDRSRISIQEAYQVTHDVDTLQHEIVQAVGIPGVGTSYSGLPDVTVTKASISVSSPIMSIVAIDYEGTASDLEPTAGVSLAWSSVESDEAIDQDFNGLPITTVNGEVIEGITMKVADQVLTIRRRMLSFDPYIINAYRHSTNSDTFAGFPPGMGRLTQYDAQQSGGQWDVTAAVQFRYPYKTTAAQAWYARILHEGFWAIPDGGGSARKARDESGEPVTRPVLLRANGKIERNSANAIWIYKQIYGSLPYNALGLL